MLERETRSKGGDKSANGIEDARWHCRARHPCRCRRAPSRADGRRRQRRDRAKRHDADRHALDRSPRLHHHRDDHGHGCDQHVERVVGRAAGRRRALDGWWYSRTEDATAFLPDGAAGIISAAAIGAGGNHTCALLADHTVRCWGDNSNGQLGDGTRVNRLSPVAVIGVTTATAIAAGQSSTCALLADATVTCWPVSGSLTPMAVAGITTATAIAGQGQMCALLADQTVRCWTSSSAPVAIDGITTATAISVGSYHACALLSDRSVRCWGANNWGQLGDGTQVSSASPVTVAGVNDAMAVSAGGYHTCALLVDGGIRCWGDNYTGELGDGSGSVKSFTPVTPVGIGPAIAISTFSHHTCALLADRTIRCWGFNYYGQLGNGTTTSSPVPVAVAGVESAIAISTGEEHSCALFADHTLHCWGRNWSGEYGDGTEVSRTSVDTLANGPHRVCVRASDGEWSDGSACSGFTVYDASLGVVTFAPLTTTPTSGAGVDYRLQFDTDVTGLASTSFSVAGSAAAGPGVCTVTPSSSSGTEFTVSVSGCSEGTLALTLHSGAVIGGGGALPPRDVGAPAVVIDRTPPGSSASIAAAYATGSTAAVTYLASDNLSGIVRVSAYYSGDPGLSSPTACGAVIGTATSGTVTCSIPALDGTYYVYTVATDAAGNVEEAPATPDASIIRDALAPGVSLTNVNGIARSFPVILKPSIASVGGACATGGGPISITLDGGATTPGTAACTSGAWLLTFSTAVGAEGVHMLSASQTNGSGHTAGTGAVSVRVDTTAPVVAGPSLSNELVDAGTPVTITSSATDPGGVASIQVSIEGGPWTSMNPVGGSWGGAVQTATSSVNAATTSITAGPYYTCTLLVDGTESSVTAPRLAISRLRSQSWMSRRRRPYPQAAKAASSSSTTPSGAGETTVRPPPWSASRRRSPYRQAGDMPARSSRTTASSAGATIPTASSATERRSRAPRPRP